MNSEFEIIFSPKALKDLKSLDKTIQIRIKEAVLKLTHFPPNADILKLKGGQGNEFRLRIGDWRVVFEYQFKEKEVHVLTIKNRRDAYR